MNWNIPVIIRSWRKQKQFSPKWIEVTFNRSKWYIKTVKLLDNDNFGNQAKQSFLKTISWSDGKS